MERSDVCLEEMKRNVNNEYFKLVISALKSKQNTGNICQAFKIWAVATVWYGAGKIRWTKKNFNKWIGRLENSLPYMGDSAQGHV